MVNDDAGADDGGAVDVDSDDGGDVVEPDCEDCEDTGTALWDFEQEIDHDDPDWDSGEPDQRAPQVVVVGAGSRCHCCDSHQRRRGSLLWLLPIPRLGGGSGGRSGEEGGLFQKLTSMAGAFLGRILPGRRDQ